MNDTLHPDASYFHLNLASPEFSLRTHSKRVTFKDDLDAQLKEQLGKAATYPASHKMVISCRAFGQFEKSWMIVIDKSRDANVGDVLHSIYKSMHKLASQEEWKALSERRSRRVSEACSDRNKRRGEKSSPYLTRVDFLDGRHYFGGLERDRERGGYYFKLIVKEAPAR